MRSWSCQRMQSSTGASTSVAGTLLPMPGMDGFRPHASEEALHGRVAQAAALRAHGARQPIPSHEPGPPRPPAVAAAAGMHQGDARPRAAWQPLPPASGRPAPRRDRTRRHARRSCRRGSRPAARGTPFPSPALIPVMSASHFPFGCPAVKPRSARLPGAGVVSPPQEPYPRRSGACATSPPPATIPRTAFSETRVRGMALTLRYPYPPPEAANAPATRTRGPAYLSAPGRAWRQ